MRLHRGVVFCFVLVVLLSAVGATWGATRVRDGDIGTIGAALAYPDGTTVTMQGEQVMWRGKSGRSFAIKEWFDKRPAKPRLVVVSRRMLPVRDGWSVDLTGVLATFSSIAQDGSLIRRRVLIVSPAQVSVFCDPKGRPLLLVPTKQWGNKRTLADLSGGVATASISTMDEGSLPPIPDDPSSSPSPPAPGSRDSVKWLADGASVSLGGVIVTLAFSDNDGRSCFYVERSDRSFGIRVHPSPYHSVGQGWLVNVSGYMATVKGEREIVANTVTRVDGSNVYPLPLPVGMPNKLLGGGAVGPYTPPVPLDTVDPTKNGTGLNTTGLLVRAWGKVADPYWGYYYGIFYIDDGSNVQAGTDPDAQTAFTGIKVYDTTGGNLPSADDQLSITGVSGAVFQSASSTASIRTLWQTFDVSPSTQPGATATVTGTITAAGANGKTVRVFAGTSSTTAAFSGNTASYSLTVRAGDNAVTASVIGYQTTTQLASVSNGQTVTKDFTLASIARVIDVTPVQSRIAPDGVSETVVTAVVRDLEGRRISNAPISWDVDCGTLLDAESTTNAVGEATAIARSSTNHETATVTVHAGSVSGSTWVEYGSPGDPSILPINPILGQVVSGEVTIRYWLGDPSGNPDKFYAMEVFVDGQSIGLMMRASPYVQWETFTVPNGQHTVKAQATDADGSTMWSPVTVVQVDNFVSELSVSPDEFNPSLGEHATIAATLQESVDWQLTIKDSTGQNTVFTTTGHGASVSCQWDGTTSLSEDAFEYTVTATS